MSKGAQQAVAKLHDYCELRNPPSSQFRSGGVYAKRGRIPPPPVAEKGGRSPNEQRLLDEGACRRRLKGYCELRGEAKSAKELRSERGFSFLSDFLTVKEKDTDFFLHKKICKPNESRL